MARRCGEARSAPGPIPVSGTKPRAQLPTPGSIRDALDRLREVSDNAELVESIPVELCRAGFSRAMYSAIEHNTWISRSVHAVGNPAQAKTLLSVGRTRPRTLTSNLLESAMVRKNAPVLVLDPRSNPNVHVELVKAAQPEAYVAAPIYLWGQPIGMLHADRSVSAGSVNTADADLIGLLAESIAVIIERNIAVQRIHTLQETAHLHMREIHSLAAMFDEYPRPDDADELPKVPIPNDVCPAGELLSHRELQVLQLISAGSTNKQIADRLRIGAGTVKCHVRNIMNKLGVHNRDDAVARSRDLLSN